LKCWEGNAFAGVWGEKKRGEKRHVLWIGATEGLKQLEKEKFRGKGRASIPNRGGV